MPKITDWRYRIDGKDIIFAVAYSSKDYKFYVTLPPWMAGVLEKDKIVGDTQRQVEENLKESIDEYGRRKTTELKVIFYTFKSMVRPLNFIGPNQAQGLSEMCSEGVALDLWFKVGYVIKNPSKYQEIYVDENHVKPPQSWNQLGERWVHYMPCTKEREQFFLAFRQYLIEGIEKMQNFFKNKDALPPLIDSVVRKNQLPFIRAK